MFDPRDPYERYYWHYDSRRPLSVAQLIALHCIDVETAALIWLLLEHGTSLTIAGPTDPQPGVGKTTTLNALLQFLPERMALAYMSGMYEDFAFTCLPDIDPTTVYALCNEVSNHLPIYMWGRVAKRYLTLPAEGYHIATSMHADTIDDVMYIYQRDLHLSVEDISQLGLVVNIGVIGQSYPLSRRWIMTHFFPPQPDAEHSDTLVPIPLSLWNEENDTFTRADQTTLERLAAWVGSTSVDFIEALTQRTQCLHELSQDQSADVARMQHAVAALRKQEQTI